MLYPLVPYNPQINLYSSALIRPTNQVSMSIISQPLTPETYLFTSIIIETLSTCCLKLALNNKLFYIPMYLGYGTSFYIFPKCLTKFSLSSAYTIWCGLGIIMTTVIDKLFYKELITIKKLCGTLIIILGIGITK